MVIQGLALDSIMKATKIMNKLTRCYFLSVPNPSTHCAKIARIAYAHNSERCQVKRDLVVVCYCWCKLSNSYRRGFCDSLKGFPLNQKIKSIQLCSLGLPNKQSEENCYSKLSSDQLVAPSSRRKSFQALARGKHQREL